MKPADCLALVKVLCANDEFKSFGFSPASVMATCEVESAFNEHAYRFEPRLGEASFGLMQVLESTARSLGWQGTDLTELYDPTRNLTLGMRYLRQGWDYLLTHLGRRPTPAEWTSGYNEGYGAAARGRPDPDYADKWLAARARWLEQI